MNTQDTLKRGIIGTMDEIRQETDEPVAAPRPPGAAQQDAVLEAYKRGAAKVEAITGRKTKLPAWAKGKQTFPPAKEVTE